MCDRRRCANTLSEYEFRLRIALHDLLHYFRSLLDDYNLRTYLFMSNKSPWYDSSNNASSSKFYFVM